MMSKETLYLRVARYCLEGCFMQMVDVRPIGNPGTGSLTRATRSGFLRTQSHRLILLLGRVGRLDSMRQRVSRGEYVKIASRVA